MNRAAVVVAAALFLLATPAHAHGSASLGDFYAGLFQPFFHFEFLFGALAIALWSTQQSGRAPFATCAGFAAGVMAGSAGALLELHPAAAIWGPRVAMLLIGSLVAARVSLPLALGVSLAVAAGLAHGNAATGSELGEIAQPLPWLLGLGLGVALLGAYANAATQHFEAFWMQVGIRVVGSWIAAIGLLVGAVAVRSR